MPLTRIHIQLAFFYATSAVIRQAICPSTLQLFPCRLIPYLLPFCFVVDAPVALRSTPSSCPSSCQGRRTLGNGSVYTGEILDWMPHGLGQLQEAGEGPGENKPVWTGLFADGLPRLTQ